MNDSRANFSEIVTVAVSPYHTARGPIVRMGPAPDEVTISVGTNFVHGKCLPLTMGVA